MIYTRDAHNAQMDLQLNVKLPRTPEQENKSKGDTIYSTVLTAVLWVRRNQNFLSLTAIAATIGMDRAAFSMVISGAADKRGYYRFIPVEKQRAFVELVNELRK